MKINKIKLYNFSSYEGENIIDFSIKDNEKNIILIGGKNGAGKTSLFTAITSELKIVRKIKIYIDLVLECQK